MLLKENSGKTPAKIISSYLRKKKKRTAGSLLILITKSLRSFWMVTKFSATELLKNILPKEPIPSINAQLTFIHYGLPAAKSLPTFSRKVICTTMDCGLHGQKHTLKTERLITGTWEKEKVP